uniref:Uncharacterized protein n=1 Tax=Arundo donax TaxID=35708 RepID=A0A0A9J7R4_ARUDO
MVFTYKSRNIGLYSADNDDEVMVKSSIRFKNAGQSLIEILKSLTSSKYILYIPLGLEKIWMNNRLQVRRQRKDPSIRN